MIPRNAKGRAPSRRTSYSRISALGEADEWNDGRPESAAALDAVIDFSTDSENASPTATAITLRQRSENALAPAHGQRGLCRQRARAGHPRMAACPRRFTSEPRDGA